MNSFIDGVKLNNSSQAENLFTMKVTFDISRLTNEKWLLTCFSYLLFFGRRRRNNKYPVFI